MRDARASFPTVSASSVVLGALAVAASLFLLVTPASATIIGHSYDFSFGGSGASTLSAVNGIAVDNSGGPSSGSVYVGDAINARVEKFDAAGNFDLMFGDGVNETSGGDVCPRPGFPADVCKAGTAGSGPGQFTTPKYLAVDWTNSPSAGDVYVLDPSTQLVQKFDSSGALIGSWAGPPNGPAGGQLDGSGVPVLGAWTDAQGIAVGPDGTLNVMNRLSSPGGMRLYTFAEDGAFGRSLLINQRPYPTGLAMDTLGNFLAGGPNGNGGEYKYRGSDGQTIAGDFSSAMQGGYEVHARTVDVSPDPRRTDDYYLVTNTTVNHAHWQQPNKWLQSNGSYCYAQGSGCPPTTTFGSAQLGEATGVAVSNSGTVYVTDNTPKKVMVFPAIITPDTTNVTASNVEVEAATVSGDVGLAGGPDVTDCYFEYGRSEGYEKAPVPCTPEASEGSPFTSDQAVEAQLTNLLPNSVYHFRLVATNSNGTNRSEDVTFTTPGPPGIEAFSTSNLTASSVDLNAKINPHGDETSYYFNYGISTAYGETAPATLATIPAGLTAQDVTAHVSLEDATYHFQVVATNKYGTTTSEDQTFSFHPELCPNQTVRQQTGAAYLPDCRAYELVSPGDSGSAFIFTGGPQRPYADPPRFAFTGDYGDMPEAGGDPITTTGDLYVSRRGSSGWTTKFVGVPGSVSGCAGGRPQFGGAGLASTVQNDVKADRNLTRIVDWQLGNPTQCVWDTIGGSFRFTDNNSKTHASMAPWMWETSDGSFVDRLPTSVADVPGSDEDFNCPQINGQSADTNCSNAVELSGDLTHFVFSTQQDIYNGGPDALSAAPGSAYDNDVVNNTLSLTSVLPGGGPIGQESSPNGGPNEVIQFPKVSEDGSHILMGTLKNPQCRQREYPPYYNFICPQVSNPTHLYMRVNDIVTYEVAPVPVTYVDSTPDARKVYFTTAQALNGEDTDSSIDLYMWSDLGGAPSLTVVSKGSNGGNGTNCNASWIAGCNIEAYKDQQISSASSNRGGLSPNWFTPGEEGAQAAPGNTGTKGFTDNAVATGSGDIVFYSPEDLDGTGIARAINVYLYRKGTTQLVATLEDDPYCLGDDSIEGIADIRPERCSDGPLGRLQITPDGRYIAFITTTRLTAYENQGYAEMYRYDAETRRILCISCRPDGLPPTSDVLGSYTGRFISDDGRVFFTTNEEIDPRDSNTSKDILTGKTLGADVYEYSGGVPKLITSGTGQQAGGIGLTAEAWPGLLGVSGDGTDVYFMWTEPLVGQDLNGLNNYRIYDARTNGGFLYNPPAPPCQAADECHDIPSQPAVPASSGTSAALGSGGNAQPIAKKKKKKSRHRKHRKHRRKARKHRRNGRRGHLKGAGRQGRASHANTGGRR